MKFKKFLDASDNVFSKIRVYFDRESYDDCKPDMTIVKLDRLDSSRRAVLNMYVEEWYVDDRFELNVLLFD